MSGLQVQWLGTDGSTWDLLQGSVRTGIQGVKGLGMPDSIIDQLKTFALLDGQRLMAWKLGPRAAWLPLKFKGAGELDVEGVQRAWWKSLAIGVNGTLVVTDGSGAVRRLTCRFAGDGGMVYAVQPYIRSDAFGIDLIADSPWWRGDPVSFSFGVGAGDGQSFFGNGAGATPFYLQPNGGTGVQNVTNPGDVPSYPTIMVTGPVSAWSVVINGSTVSGPPVAAGDVLAVYTDPARQIAYLYPAGGGAAQVVTNQLTQLGFAPVPAGSSVPVTINTLGTGTVAISFNPRYFRAF